MAKRKKRRSKKNPNLPLAALERARQQLNEDESVAEEPGETVIENAENEAVQSAVVAEPGISDADRAALRRERRESRKNQDSDSFQYSRRKKKSDGMDNAEIEEKLMNPTKFVTEEELRKEYRYVIADLRSMGILAAALLVFLVVLAQAI
jgi:hypothetical protein